MNLQKVAIIGCGFVGATTAFALMQSGIFTELVLIDANKQKALGEAMDLSHCLPFTKPMEIYAGDYSNLKDAGIIIITAGAGQKEGETRLDLIDKNVNIFKSIVPQIVKYNNDAILLVVSNPVDVLTYVTLKLSGYPSNRVFGSGTVLDSARLKLLISNALNVDPRSVHAFIIGEHGDSELAVWSSANVSGIPIKKFVQSSREDIKDMRHAIYQDVKNSAYQIIQKKGATYYGISYAVRRICQSVVRDEHSILPVSNYVTGHYGLNDLYIGVPSLIGSNGVEEIFDIDLNADEQIALLKSAQTLKEAINRIRL